MIEEHSAGSGSYQVVARRHRPKTFEELVGQEHIVRALSNALTKKSVGHAYLFTGARGTGKTTSARIFAKMLNCVEGPTLTPCGKCDSCVSIGTGEDIDVLEIDAASNRGIEDIRQLRQNASIRPSRSRFKIYILDEVHMLTNEAFNALLKIFEEPPEHIKFIFCTTEPQKIPITILSRCQRFDFAGIDTAKIVGHLQMIADKENVSVEDGVFETLSRRASGSMRDALSLLEQLLSFASERISLADVNEMLGTANDQMLLRLLGNMLDSQPQAIFAELDAAASQGVDFAILVEQLLNVFRDLLVIASGGDASLLLFCSSSLFDEVKMAAERFGIHRILAAMQILDQTYTKMQHSTQGRILVELALVRIAHLDHFQQIAVLLEQLRGGKIATSPAASPPVLRPAQKAILNTTKPADRVVEQTPDTSNQTSVSQNENTASANFAPTDSAISSLKPVGYNWPVSADNAGNVAAIWEAVADKIPGMLGSAMTRCTAVQLEGANTFVVTFTNKMSKDHCEKEASRLKQALMQQTGKTMNVRFVLDSNPEPPKPAPMAGKTMSAQEERERFQDALDNPFVKKVQEVFGAALKKVE
ncbi:DNA polymerase III, subunit gamma and tau [Planctomycetales bacterium]|nr:DNA polymerase III, subunit gamma and tau [Planctomycetales bacterium]